MKIKFLIFCILLGQNLVNCMDQKQMAEKETNESHVVQIENKIKMTLVWHSYADCLNVISTVDVYQIEIQKILTYKDLKSAIKSILAQFGFKPSEIKIFLTDKGKKYNFKNVMDDLMFDISKFESIYVEDNSL